MAAENEGAMTPTRVQSETLNFTNEAAENVNTWLVVSNIFLPRSTIFISPFCAVIL